MRPETRTTKYIKALSRGIHEGTGRLVEPYKLLSKERRKVARRLVQDYGWKVDIAIQHACIFSGPRWVLNYRTRESEEVNW